MIKHNIFVSCGGNKMKDILTAPFVREMMETTANMYRLGWDERNGGNISYMLDENDVAEYLDVNEVIRTIPIGFEAKSLIGKCFIVTGTGKYFKNVEKDPENNLGIIRIADDGTIKGDQADMLGEIDSVINVLSGRVTTLGAAQNRIDSAIESIGVQSENITSSLSTLRDADIAEESSSYIKYQILQQSAATLLSTANQQPQIALNLL